MVEACRTVVCFNIIKAENPCKKLHCLNCAINYYQYKQKQPSGNCKDNVFSQSKTSIDQQEKQKKNQNKLLRKNLKQKAFQNVLFTCPCCQEECSENYQDISYVSLCKLSKIIENKPLQMLQKHILILLDQKILQQSSIQNKLIQSNQFVLAQIVGYDKPKKVFKIVMSLKGNDALKNLDQMIDYKGGEEQYFESNLSPINVYFMFVSTILQHNDYFTLKDNEKADSQTIFQDNKSKKIINSRLYKLLNSVIQKNEKMDDFSIQSKGDFKNRLIRLDIKNEIQDGISSLKKSEGKEFGYQQKYSEHVQNMRGLDFSPTQGQQFYKKGHFQRIDYVQQIRQNNLTKNKNTSENNDEKIINNLEDQKNQQIEEQKNQEVKESQTYKQESQQFEQLQLNGPRDNDNIQQEAKQLEKQNIHQQVDESIQQNGNYKEIILENIDNYPQEKNLLKNDQCNENTDSQINRDSSRKLEAFDSNQIQENSGDKQKIKEELKQTQKRYIVPVVNQKKLENVQKQLEKEFRKIEKLKTKQNNQDVEQTQNKTLSFQQKEKQVIYKSEQKIDRLLKQENYLQNCQNFKLNQENLQKNSENDLLGQKLEYQQDVYHPREVKIHSKKLNINEDPDKQQQDPLNVIKAFQLVQNSRQVDGKLFIKRFKTNKRLKMHSKFLREYASQKPEDFINMIIYKLNPQQNLWYRSKIVSYHEKQLGEEKKMSDHCIEFEIQLMNQEKSQEWINTTSDVFIIDQAQDQKQSDELLSNSISNNKRLQKKPDLNENEFNNFYKLHKILLKEWQRNEKGMSLKEAIQYEDPKFNFQFIQQQKKDEESKLELNEKFERKRKKGLIVIQTSFPFAQRINPQMLQPNQRKWINKMKSTPRKKHLNNLIKIHLQNTPTFKNLSSVDQQIYYSDISSEDAYDQQSLNIDNHRSIDQLKIHYCKEIVQHYQFQQNQLNTKQYQQRPLVSSNEIESQSNLNTMDVFLANTQKQMNYINQPSASNHNISLPSQPISNYGDSSSN